MQTLCSRCGAPVLKSYGKPKPGGGFYVTTKTLLGNPHHCPRGGPVAALLDQGKRPFAELEKRRAENSAKRVARNEAKGLIAHDDEREPEQ